MSVASVQWEQGDNYERFIGRWSRKLAPEFVAWARLPGGSRAIDVGCGTGALSAALLSKGASSVVGVDLSAGFVASAAEFVKDARASFKVGDATALDFADGTFDAAVSGLCLNFTPDPAKAVGEMARVVRPGGLVGVYVWDYAGKMEMLRRFWDTAVELDPDRAGPLDEGARFPVCHPRPLAQLFGEAGFKEVATAHIDTPATFEGFEDFWDPFLGGQGPAPTYVAGLSGNERDDLRDALERRVRPNADGRICLEMRAWAVRGVKE